MAADEGTDRKYFTWQKLSSLHGKYREISMYSEKLTVDATETRIQICD